MYGRGRPFFDVFDHSFVSIQRVVLETLDMVTLSMETCTNLSHGNQVGQGRRIQLSFLLTGFKGWLDGVRFCRAPPGREK